MSRVEQGGQGGQGVEVWRERRIGAAGDGGQATAETQDAAFNHEPMAAPTMDLLAQPAKHAQASMGTSPDPVLARAIDLVRKAYDELSLALYPIILATMICTSPDGPRYEADPEKNPDDPYGYPVGGANPKTKKRNHVAFEADALVEAADGETQSVCGLPAVTLVRVVKFRLDQLGLDVSQRADEEKEKTRQDKTRANKDAREARIEDKFRQEWAVKEQTRKDELAVATATVSNDRRLDLYRPVFSRWIQEVKKRKAEPALRDANNVPADVQTTVAAAPPAASSPRASSPLPRHSAQLRDAAPTFPETQATRDATGYEASDIQDAVAEEIRMRSSPPPTAHAGSNSEASEQLTGEPNDAHETVEEIPVPEFCLGTRVEVLDPSNMYYKQCGQVQKTETETVTVLFRKLRWCLDNEDPLDQNADFERGSINLKVIDHFDQSIGSKAVDCQLKHIISVARFFHHFYGQHNSIRDKAETLLRSYKYMTHRNYLALYLGPDAAKKGNLDVANFAKQTLKQMDELLGCFQSHDTDDLWQRWFQYKRSDLHKAFATHKSNIQGLRVTLDNLVGTKAHAPKDCIATLKQVYETLTSPGRDVPDHVRARAEYFAVNHIGARLQASTGVRESVELVPVETFDTKNGNFQGNLYEGKILQRYSLDRLRDGNMNIVSSMFSPKAEWEITDRWAATNADMFNKALDYWTLCVKNLLAQGMKENHSKWMTFELPADLKFEPEFLFDMATDAGASREEIRAFLSPDGDVQFVQWLKAKRIAVADNPTTAVGLLYKMFKDGPTRQTFKLANGPNASSVLWEPDDHQKIETHLQHFQRCKYPDIVDMLQGADEKSRSWRENHAKEVAEVERRFVKESPYINDPRYLLKFLQYALQLPDTDDIDLLPWDFQRSAALAFLRAHADLEPHAQAFRRKLDLDGNFTYEHLRNLTRKKLVDDFGISVLGSIVVEKALKDAPKVALDQVELIWNRLSGTRGLLRQRLSNEGKLHRDDLSARLEKIKLLRDVFSHMVYIMRASQLKKTTVQDAVSIMTTSADDLLKLFCPAMTAEARAANSAFCTLQELLETVQRRPLRQDTEDRRAAGQYSAIRTRSQTWLMALQHGDASERERVVCSAAHTIKVILDMGEGHEQSDAIFAVLAQQTSMFKRAFNELNGSTHDDQAALLALFEEPSADEDEDSKPRPKPRSSVFSKSQPVPQATTLSKKAQKQLEKEKFYKEWEWEWEWE
eukprot:COSAG06_NODE_3980_length_4692_cov_4.531679_2_plen_1228_part_00